MKLKHTTKKEANRSFDTSATGYPSEQYRKQQNQVRNSPDKSPTNITKPKPRRKRVVKTHV